MRGVQQVSVTDLVTKKHITMEKWKKNKRNLSEERMTCLIWAEFDPTHRHRRKPKKKETSAINTVAEHLDKERQQGI